MIPNATGRQTESEDQRLGEGKRLKAKGCNGRNGRDGGRNDRDGQGERAKEDQRNDMRPRDKGV